MTDTMKAPEPIWAFEHGLWGKDYENYQPAPTEYIRKDVSDALIAAAYDVAGDAAADAYDALDVPTGSDVAGFVRSLTPADARAALDRVREEALREAEKWKTAFAAQSRKLQSVLHIPGVKEALAQKDQTKRPRASVSPDYSWEDQNDG